MEPKPLLDKDVPSGLMRNTRKAVDRARHYLADYSQLTISLVTRFEVLRGLKAKGATTQLAACDAFCSSNEILPIIDAVVVRAADIFADLHARGRLISDADTLIAATVLENGFVVATSNVADFGGVAGLAIDSWPG